MNRSLCNSISGRDNGAPNGLPDWLDPRPYEALNGIDRAGLMWEWLRRDPAYCAASGQMDRTISEVRNGFRVIQAPDDHFAASWGLHFCRNGRYRRKVSNHPVACRL